MAKKTEQTKTVQLTVEELQSLGCRLSNIKDNKNGSSGSSWGVSCKRPRFIHLYTPSNQLSKLFL